jgi:hypothetical protein
MNYAYQHAFGHSWNDFDGWPWRDHNFTYPTVDGSVGTRQFEGYREAIDDVRYLATLKGAIRKVPIGKESLAEAAQQWLDHLDPDYDLNDLRQNLVAWIYKLQP